MNSAVRATPVQHEDDSGRHEAGPVLFESPPHQLPLGGYEYPLLLDVGGYSLRYAALGLLRW